MNILANLTAAGVIYLAAVAAGYLRANVALVSLAAVAIGLGVLLPVLVLRYGIEWVGKAIELVQRLQFAWYGRRRQP